MGQKRASFSLGRFGAQITGGALTGAASFGAASCMVPDPTFATQLLAVLTGAVAGGVGASVGALWGIATDDAFMMEFRSELLFSSVVGLSIAMPFVLLGYLIDGGERLDSTYLFAVVGFATVITGALTYLLDDRRIRNRKHDIEFLNSDAVEEAPKDAEIFRLDNVSIDVERLPES